MDRRARALGLLVAGLLACATPPPVRTVPYSGDLLAATRAALSFDSLLEHPGGFELIGDRVHATGTTSFRFSFDGRGRSILDLAAPVQRAEGFDGLRSWSQDPSGLVRELGRGEAERIRCEAWLRVGLWLDPWVPRFTSSIDVRQSTPERIAVALARPDTPFRATVWIDAETSLPLEYELRGARSRVRLEAWTRVAGARLPQRFVRVFAGGGEVVDEVRLTTPTSPLTFAPPRPLPRDTRFEPLASPVVEARIGADGRLYARAVLDGARNVTLLVDSGFGASAIDPLVANELAWPALGRAALDGVGGRGASSWRRSGRLELGPLTIEGLEFVELDGLHASQAAGFTVEGVLGADALARAVFDIEPAFGTLRVHDPSRWERPELDWRPVQLDGAAPCIEARIGVVERLWLRLDTGSSDTLSVAPWAVAALNLAPSIVDLESVFLVGPFGSVRGWRGELAEVELAGARFKRLPATFLDPIGDAGLLDNPWIAGNLGLPAFRAARLFLDLGRRRIAVQTAL